MTHLVTIRPMNKFAIEPSNIGKFEYPNKLIQKNSEYLHPMSRALRVTIADPKINKKKFVANTSSACDKGTCKISTLSI